MDNWQYKAYKTDISGNRIEEIVEGEMSAISFPHLALLLRQRGFQVLHATRLNPDQSIASKRLAKMKARITPPNPEPEIESEKHITTSTAIHSKFSWLIPSFLKR